MNANLIFKWLKEPRYAPAACDAPIFLPVEITPSLTLDRMKRADEVRAVGHLGNLKDFQGRSAARGRVSWEKLTYFTASASVVLFSVLHISRSCCCCTEMTVTVEDVYLELI